MCEGCADMSGTDACERCHWGLQWSSLRGHKACEACRHGWRRRMRTVPLGPGVELPMGSRSV
eukprot:2965068-Pyramimonas_sp.AAC.1